MAITAADLSPNFINPQYATPEQAKSLRDYADQLMTGKGQMPVHRWTQGVSNIVNALIGGAASAKADNLQQSAAQQNAQNWASLLTQQQSGQKPDPQLIGQLMATPMASPEQRASVAKQITPEPIKSEYGQPAFQSPATGVNAAPINGAFNPGYRVEQGAEGVHTNAPIPAPIPSTAKVVGDREAVARGLYDPPQGSPQPLTLDALAAKGREFAAQKEFTQGGAQAVNTVQKDDIASASNAPVIKRIAGTMLDDLKTHGDKMTFGPTAEWSNTIKRAAANYLPGAMKDQLEGLASADSFDKMSAQLTSMLAKGGGTDAQLFNNMKSVPGAHNSKEGAEALLKMVNQVADQQQSLRQYTQGAPDAKAYEAKRNEFYAKNPVVNPITGNPISMDLKKDKDADNGGFKVIKVH
jgi:ABC-type transporter MlaC component